MKDELQYVCETGTAKVYMLRRIGGSSAWADITIRDWPDGGSLNIQSDYGNYQHSWRSTGCNSLIEFLIGLNFDYFMKKCCKGYLVYSHEETLKRTLSQLIAYRKYRFLNKEEARECMNQIKTAFPYGSSNIVDFVENLPEIVTEMVYDNDYSNIPEGKTPRYECVGFWEEVWPCACEVWRKELEEQASGQL
jgi:hypothetical protein